MTKKMTKLRWEGGGGGGGEEKRRDDNFKVKSRRQKKQMMMMTTNMVQIHDEQRSIQKTISRRDTRKNTAQTSTVIINNGSKNSKCRPKSGHNK